MENFKHSMKHYGQQIVFSTMLLSGSALLLLIINFVVPNAYMDEIFHVDQMQRYCQGRFSEWNDKLTTPPALYLVSYAIWKIIIWPLDFLGIQFDCNSVTHLRFLNIIFLLPLYFVICEILKIHWKWKISVSPMGVSRYPIILYSTALNLCFFPVLYFTAFLYYTDVLSTLFVMTTYLFYLRRWKLLSALFGTLSCAVRQTNIIWVAFCFYLTIVDVTVDTLSCMDKKSRIGRRKRDDSDSMDDQNINETIYESDPMAFIHGLKRFWQNSHCIDIQRFLFRCIANSWSYILVGIGFILFVIWNRGVALGDRSAHQACPHLVQFFYFTVFTCIFGFAVILSKDTIKSVIGFIFRRPIWTVVSLLIILLIICGFTYDHPYLLADNRHYTFYIWRRWFMRHSALKYILAPAYFCAILVIYNTLAIPRSALWRFGFFICVILVTIPNRLLEFRYFILPYFFWRLKVNQLTKQRLAIEFLVFSFININAFMLFLTKPFKWSNSDDWQRFMW